MSKNSNVFNDFLARLGEKPMEPIAADASEDVLELEISEMEDKLGLPHELNTEKREVNHENN